MSITITNERPDTPEAMQFNPELNKALNPDLYPTESKHGFNVEKLLRDGVAFFVTRHAGIPAGCGGIKLFGTDYGELKRMYVRPQFRGLGLGKLMIDTLARHAKENHVHILRLETGIYQTDAVHLYERYGFERRGPFGEYREDPLSIYYELALSANVT